MATLAYRKRARRDGLADAQCGAVTFVQRFGSSLNLNVHFHVVVLDGVFTREQEGRARFHLAPAPTRDQLTAILMRVQKRALTWLRRRGLLRETPLEERSDEDPVEDALGACAAVALARGTYERLPIDEESGRKEEPEPTSALGVERDGFNLHAGVHIAAHDDVSRERLCRYGARPPLALDRLRRLRDGRVAYRVKYARRGRAKQSASRSRSPLTAQQTAQKPGTRRLVAPRNIGRHKRPPLSMR